MARVDAGKVGSRRGEARGIVVRDAMSRAAANENERFKSVLGL